MARQPRLAVAGQLHQVLLEGHNGQPVFLQDADRADFLAMLQDVTREQSVAVHAYVLLDGAVHLLVTPQAAENLGRLMQALGRRYVSAFNRRHGRSGTLWNGRFRSSVLQASAWLLPATVAIESAPQRAGSVAAAPDWPWSSARHHLGRERSALVNEHPGYWTLGNTPFERELAHANLLREGISARVWEELDQALRSARVLGDAGFLAEISLASGRAQAGRPRGRPPKLAKVH